MSKGYSGLFHIKVSASISNEQSTANEQSNKKEQWKSDAEKAIIHLIDSTHGSKRKSMAAGAYDNKTGRCVSAFAGEIPDVIHPKLQEMADSIGGIGTHGLSPRNILGVCAEFHVVNKMLLAGTNWADIRLVAPVRPRTGEKMPLCENCKAMFSELIHKD